MGKLVQVDTFTISSPVASIILGGGSSGSSGLNASINTDDVYMLTVNGAGTSSDAVYIHGRVTVSGTPDTSANYDGAWKALRTAAAHANGYISNQTVFQFIFGDYLGTGVQEKCCGIFYLHNFNNASEYSFLTAETAQINAIPEFRGNQGGLVHTVAQSCDGIQLLASAGNINAGTFTLYKVL